MACCVVVGEGGVLVNLLHLGEFSRPGAVGSDDAVVHEVALMRAGVVVARHVFGEAVHGEVARENGLRVVDRLVHPVPNATADAELAVLDDVPIFLEVAYAVAHGVGVFAHEEGLRAAVAGRLALHVGKFRVHDGMDVGPLRGAGVGGAFVVDGARVEGAGGIVGSGEAYAHAALIAQRPEDDGGVVAVAQDSARAAVGELPRPRRLVGDGAVVAILVPILMAFEVELVHHVDAVVVEHGVHLGLSRIVAGAHGVDVGLLHEHDVFKHRFYVDTAAAERVGVLRVHALEEDALAVDEYHAVGDADIAEAVAGREGHFLRVALVHLANGHGVEHRRLGRPKAEVAHGNLNREVFFEVGCGVIHGGRLGCHGFALGRNQRHFHLLGAGAALAVVERHGHGERAGGVGGRGKGGGDIVVAHGNGRRGIEINIAVETRHVEHVLAFEIGAVAPAEHLHANIILARAEIGCEVELGIVVAALSIAHVLPVKPHEGCAVQAVEVEVDALTRFPALGQGKRAAVRADGVVAHALNLIGDVGRIVHESIFYIHVQRQVVAFHLPAGGHFDFVPTISIGIVGIKIFLAGALRRLGHELELPHAVEREVVRLFGREPRLVVIDVGTHGSGGGVRNISGMAIFLIILIISLVLPFGAHFFRHHGKTEARGFGCGIGSGFEV